ncbi:MAG: flagellar protein FliS [Clostridiales bacterium]|jgi:flagellar biosynthetic protein FliS|nr:flagellar protein FliS [Clostridiales bacterium]
MDKSAYLMRISQASPAGLVVINFELIIDFLNEAVAQKENTENFRALIAKAKDGLEQLIQALDFEIPLSHDFYEIYKYSYKLLCDVIFSADTEAACSALKEVAELMETLLVGWRDVLDKTPVVEAAEAAAPKVYTGLTYGRDGQANEYIDENNDRSYMA